MLIKKNSERLTCLHSAVDLESFMQLLLLQWSPLPLKELDFGLQKRTGPSSGVVASIVLVSPGLDCPGVSLAEVCATCLKCHLW